MLAKADDFKLSMTECSNGSNTEDAAARLKCYKLITQAIVRYQKVADSNRDAARRIADELMANVNTAILRNSSTDYADILSWYKETGECSGDLGNGIAVMHEKYRLLAEGEANKMAK